MSSLPSSAPCTVACSGSLVAVAALHRLNNQSMTSRPIRDRLEPDDRHRHPAVRPARRRHRGGDRGLRRPPAGEPRLPRPGPPPRRAAPRPTGRSPSRRPCGSATARARRSTTSTAASTPTSTAGTASRLAGHAHPAIVAAVQDRVTRGTHFAQPTEDAIAVADNLAERFDQPLWRFGNSGTEATMDAVHLMRAATGRDRILKVEGCYHGHHDSVRGLRAARAPTTTSARPTGRTTCPDNSGIPRRDHGPGDGRAVQRPRRRRAGAGRAPRRGRRA